MTAPAQDGRGSGQDLRFHPPIWTVAQHQCEHAMIGAGGDCVVCGMWYSAVLRAIKKRLAARGYQQ